MENQIEIVIPKGYKKSNKSTDDKLVFELVEGNDVEKQKKDFLMGIFNKMKVRVEPSWPGHVYYDVDGMGTVFEQDFKSNYLWVSHPHIWHIFSNRFFMNLSEIQSFINNMVEETLNWRGLTPREEYCQEQIRWKKP